MVRLLEQAILVAVELPEVSAKQVQANLAELGELARTAGAEICATFTQKRLQPEPSTYVGEGKLQEIHLAVHTMGCDLVIFDDELTPIQHRNLEDLLGVRVVDRTQLILDIFAARAQSKEGKLQVELAQLLYLLPRLTGKGKALSRLGGGIGTRGPGETKLEVDRRRIRQRISALKRELAAVKVDRAAQRKLRQRRGLPLVSLVGYTNAGKSTLFNRLTQAEVMVEDKLFATLDPTVRRVELPSGMVVLLSDTVGFIRKLPHTLINAFHATLEEVIEADLLLHVVDAADPAAFSQIGAVKEVLEQIGAGRKKTIVVLNKIDLVPPSVLQGLQSYLPDAVPISAVTGQGLSKLLEVVQQEIFTRRRHLKVLIPYTQGSLVDQLHSTAQVVAEEFREEGTYLEIIIEARLADKVLQYQIQE